MATRRVRGSKDEGGMSRSADYQDWLERLELFRSRLAGRRASEELEELKAELAEIQRILSDLEGLSVASSEAQSSWSSQRTEGSHDG